MKTKTKTKNIYIENGLSLNPAYVLQLARAKYKYCRIVKGEMGRNYIFSNRKVSSRQAMFLARKQAKYYTADFNLGA